MSSQEIKKITSIFLGTENDGIRTMGLVDHDDEESFDEAYRIIKSSLPNEFVEWLQSTHHRGNEKEYASTRSISSWKRRSTEQMGQQYGRVYAQHLERGFKQ